MQGNERNDNCKKQERKVSQTQENEKTRKSGRDAGKDFTRNEERLKRFVAEIGAPDSEAKEREKERQDSLAKVPGSLGELEKISVKMAGITGNVTGNSLKKQCVALFCPATYADVERSGELGRKFTQLQEKAEELVADRKSVV